MLEGKDSGVRNHRVTADEIEAFCSRLATTRHSANNHSEHDKALAEDLDIAQAELLAQNEELKVANRALELERQRYRDLFDNAPVVHFVTDRMGVIHDLNLAALELLGGAGDSVRGRPLALYVHPDHVGAFRQCLVALPSARSVELRVKMGDRRTAFRSAQFRVSLTANPHEILWVGYGVETPPDPNEAAARTKLRDMPATLQTILGSTALLREGGLSSAGQRRELERIESAAVTQASTVESLADVVRVVSQGPNLRRTTVDVRRLAVECVTAASPAAAACGVKIDLDSDGSAETVGDEERLAQVLMHLVSNALKFTPAPGAIAVRVRSNSEGVVVAVDDTGVGLTLPSRERIFDCFHQACSEEMAQGGMGLGLFLVKKIVEAHGGSVRAISDGRGRGSTFIVKLPKAPE